MNWKELDRYYQHYGHFPKDNLTIREVILATLGFIAIVLVLAVIVFKE